MEILILRDLIQDELGNYYTVVEIDGKKLTLVNAVVFNSFKKVLNKEFVEEVNKQYNNNYVAVGQVFTDSLKTQIERLTSGKSPGSIYKLNEVAKEYKIEVDSLYERNVVRK